MAVEKVQSGVSGKVGRRLKGVGSSERLLLVTYSVGRKTLEEGSEWRCRKLGPFGGLEGYRHQCLMYP